MPKIREFVSAIVERDGKFLVMREAKRAVFWNFPGGKIEEYEVELDTNPYRCAVARELHEETGLQVEGIEFAYEREVHVDGIDWIGYYFYVETSGEASIQEPEKCLEMEWVTEDELTQLPCREGLLCLQ